MPAAVDVEKPDSFLVPTFGIRIGGTELDPAASASLRALTVDDQVGVPGMFSIELRESEEKAGPEGWLGDPDLFALGRLVEVKLGYLGAPLVSMIVGEIASLEPEFSWQGPTALVVRGYDLRDRLQRAPRTRTFLKHKDSDVATVMAQEANLTPDVKDTATVHEYLIQAGQTNLEFLTTRARRIGYEVLVRSSTLLFRPLASTRSGVPPLTLGQDLLEFYPRLSSAGQVSKLSVRAWNPSDKNTLVSQAQAGDEVSEMGGEATGAKVLQRAFGDSAATLGGYPLESQAEADALAKALFNDSELELIRGDGMCWGRTDLKAGDVVAIAGVGKRFSGDYYLTAATHRYTPDEGYLTLFSASRNAT